MNTIETKPEPKTIRHRGPVGPRVTAGAPGSRRRAAAILEVLAGARTPGQAAEAIGISLPRYYALETRALDGLVKACEPRPKGRQPSAERERAAQRKEMERLQRDLDRQRALARAAQRAMGLALPAPKPTKNGRRRRKPTVRALKAASVLRSEPPTAEPAVGMTV